MVNTENDSSIGDPHISDTCDTDPVVSAEKWFFLLLAILMFLIHVITIWMIYPLLWERKKDLVPLNTYILLLNLSPVNIFLCSIKFLLQLLTLRESHHLFKKHWKIKTRSKLWMKKWKHLRKMGLERLLRGNEARSQLDVGGSIQWNTNHMALLIVTRPD